MLTIAEVLLGSGLTPSSDKTSPTNVKLLRGDSLEWSLTWPNSFLVSDQQRKICISQTLHSCLGQSILQTLS